MKLFKYPRTPHLPWSPGRSADDKVLSGIKHFEDKILVGTIKMDGECTTLYPDYLHARSLDSKDHESRHWVKGFHAGIKHLIPPGWRICGENMFARHSILYENLESYFLGFSVWNDKNICLDWGSTTKIFSDLGIICVPVIRTTRIIEKIREDFESNYNEQEGYVVRLASEFKYEDFGRSVAKYVRVNHVQAEDHWMHKKVIPNKLGR